MGAMAFWRDTKQSILILDRLSYGCTEAWVDKYTVQKVKVLGAIR